MLIVFLLTGSILLSNLCERSSLTSSRSLSNHFDVFYSLWAIIEII